jgi:hypothetical protein
MVYAGYKGFIGSELAIAVKAMGCYALCMRDGPWYNLRKFLMDEILKAVSRAGPFVNPPVHEGRKGF